MPLQQSQTVQQILEECGYSQKIFETKTQIRNVISHFQDLKPERELFTFPNGSQKNLLCLCGTIPVLYRQKVYNIPIALYVLDNHPVSAPFCFVRPTANMKVRPSQHVDFSGRVYLPYLIEWKQNSHDLTGLVQVMGVVFGETPPVVATQNRAAQEGSQDSKPSPSRDSQQAQQILRDCGYSQISVTKAQITDVISHFDDLKPVRELFTLPNVAQKNLLCLRGTIPVLYRENVYNIPVAIYVLDNHPVSAPICFLKPTANMEVRPSQHVDVSGRVYLPYLHEWTQNSHDLTGLVEVMCVVFGESPPVVATQNPAAQEGSQDSTPSPPQGSQQVQQILRDCGYSQISVTKTQITDVISHFDDLKPVRELFTLPNGAQKNLLCLCGTIPFTSQGNVYNIPVAIYVLENHPVAPPFCFVRPTANIQVRPTANVVVSGRVYLPYLDEWKQSSHDLTGLVETMSVVFSEAIPVLETPAAKEESENSTPLSFQHSQQVQHILQECGYSQISVTKTQVRDVVSHFRDLRPVRKLFPFPDSAQKNLLCLCGTIQVTHQGNVHNIPVAIYVLDNHPATAPVCFVKPTANMEVCPNENVVLSGRVYLPYLENWSQYSHDLTSLVQTMSDVFNEVVPVVETAAHGGFQNSTLSKAF